MNQQTNDRETAEIADTVRHSELIEMLGCEGEGGKWIDVDDKLPINPETVKYYATKHVLVATRFGDVFASEFKCGNTIDFWFSFDDHPPGYITHWMMYPEPPKPVE